MSDIAACLGSLANALGVSVRERDDGSLQVRLVPAEGLCTFLTLADGTDYFAPTIRLEMSTLVATDVEPTGELQHFLDDANRTAFAGAWEWFRDGKVGLTGSLLLPPGGQPVPLPLLHQLLALQVDEARLVGRPKGSAGFDEVTSGPAPAVQRSWSRAVPLHELVARVEWRSSSHQSSRWVISRVEQDRVDFLVPGFVGDHVRDERDRLLPGLSTLSLARTVHPWRGSGIIIQAHLPASIREDALRVWAAPVATQTARWYGTFLGALTIGGEDEPELVYRAFLSDELLSVASPEQGLSLLVDAVLGSVNAAGVATRMVKALAAHADLTRLTREQRLMRQEGRAAVLRAVTQTRPTQQGTTALDGPVVDVGGAVLDRLALDQLRITTAPFVTFDRGFAWRPTASAQYVTADAMVPSRLHEVTYLRIRTRLGVVEGDDVERLRQRADRLQHTLPLSALLVRDGQVDLVSTLMVHEGVWWHRSALAAVVAAMHANLAPDLAERLRSSGLDPRPDENFAAVEACDPDSIVDVVPDLIERREPVRDEVLSWLRQRLLQIPHARRMGEDGPDAIIPLRANDHDGGWDPPLGRVAVFLTPVDDPVVGPSTQITVNAGLPPGFDVETTAAVHALTRRAHDCPSSAFVPAWVALPGTLGTVLTVPDIALSHTPWSWRPAILEQAVMSCVFEMARAVIDDPALLPGFDQALVNLARTPERVPGDLRSIEEVAIWPLMPHVRVLAVRVSRDPEHWSSVLIDCSASEALADWLEQDRGQHPPALGDLTVARSNDTVQLGFPGGHTHPLPLADVAAFVDVLRYPEGAAVRREGTVVVSPIEVAPTQEGVVCSLPPAPGVVEVLASEARFDGVTATTDRSVWLRWTSPRGSVHLDVDMELVRPMLDDHAEQTAIRLDCEFPETDARVATRAAGDGLTGRLSTRQLHQAADRVREGAR